jgi:hypothetical protein
MTWRDKLAQKANGMLPAGEYGMYLKRELLEIVAELDRLTAERDEARKQADELRKETWDHGGAFGQFERDGK